ncbi:MAG TPA: hypothetical protein VKY92_17625 [Verrucomicrobiae bacterium]|nr:hypothetical protein [Verrucomicrobiae bacterium]
MTPRLLAQALNEFSLVFFTAPRSAALAIVLLATSFGGARPLFAQDTNAPVRLPPVVVQGEAVLEGRAEEKAVGPYAQPEWTTARRFPGTRVYLQQTPWNTGFEQWVRLRDFRDGTAETRFQEEFELGLPYRFQLDLYETWAIDQDRRANQQEYSAEVRWAVADWGKVPLNPTLYLEYAQHNRAANTLEGKLLLGTDLSPRWHWGLNFACEQELSRAENTELAVSQGISYSLVDQKFGAGIEMEYYHEKAIGGQGLNAFLIGPSLQWRPRPRLHIDLAPLAGCTHDAPRGEVYLVLGIDFGTGNTERPHYTPASVRGQ